MSTQYRRNGCQPKTPAHTAPVAAEVAREAADLLEDVEAPQREGAAGAEHEAEPAPRESAVQEGTQIFEPLEAEEERPRARVPGFAARLGLRGDVDPARHPDDA